MSSPEHKELIWNYIKNIKVGMLVTKDQEGDSMRARPMQLVQEAYDGTLFFYTSKEAAKVFEIDHDRDVCISFSDPGKGIYVSLSGKAQLSEDKELIDRYWSSHVAAWFEDGREGDVGMLKVKINKGEHWDVETNEAVQLFEIAKSRLTDAEEQPELGEHEKFGVK
jgi:general stress protein 26